MNNEGLKINELSYFLNELNKKLMNSEYSDFFATFLTFNEFQSYFNEFITQNFNEMNNGLNF